MIRQLTYSTLRRFISSFVLLNILLMTDIAHGAEPDAEAPNDIRILIDVSGSMKQNDPKNLRVPAVKLLANLIPPDSRAGIWLFSEDMEKLAPLSEVNTEWKRKTLATAGRIHSRGLYTDIENAIAQATEDWNAPSQERRSIILLTDGMVDVEAGRQASQASKQRIIEQLLPRLQNANSKVYSIALSANADSQLLRRTAMATGGWYEKADNAEQLQRVFMKTFNKAVVKETLPLRNNSFQVDSSIDEFSLLVFRKAKATPTRLQAPDGTQLSQDKLPDNGAWYHEQGYDLITVKKPASGTWKLIAETDPDNQVMIVTDLKLKVTELPSYLTQNDTVELVASFTEKDNLITRRDFLDLVTIKLRQSDELERQREWQLSPETGQPGLFKQTIHETLTPGKQTFTITVDGKTFQREVVQTVDVIENPIQSSLKAVQEGDKTLLLLSLTADQKVLDPASVKIATSLGDGTGNKQTVNLPRMEDGWGLKLNVPPPDARIIINFTVTAQSLQGAALNPQVPPIILDPTRVKALLDELKPATEPENTAAPPAPAAEPSDTAETSGAPDWLWSALIVAGVNIVLIGGGIFFMRWLKKRSEQQESQLVSRLAS